MNAITLVGNLTADPKVIIGASGKQRTTFRVAVNEGQGDNEKTHFVGCTAFGTLGENVADSLHKGNRVIVSGRFDSYNKEVEIEGETKSLTMLNVTASSVGPDLRWHVAKVTKVTREGNGKPDAEKSNGKSGNAEADDFDTEDSSAKRSSSSKVSAKAASEDDGDSF